MEKIEKIIKDAYHLSFENLIILHRGNPEDVKARLEELCESGKVLISYLVKDRDCEINRFNTLGDIPDTMENFREEDNKEFETKDKITTQYSWNQTLREKILHRLLVWRWQSHVDLSSHLRDVDWRKFSPILRDMYQKGEINWNKRRGYFSPDWKDPPYRGIPPFIFESASEIKLEDTSLDGRVLYWTPLGWETCFIAGLQKGDIWHPIEKYPPDESLIMKSKSILANTTNP